MKLDSYLQLFFLGCFYFSWFLSSPAEAVRKYQFDIRVKNVSRLCYAKPIVTVNGKFPRPTVYAREGDRVLVNVTNYAQYSISIHWHQIRNGWADGPAYITQCPIKTGHSYTYDFTVMGQRGTLWWHAHILWLRATVYGAIVIMPKEGRMFPFPQPHGEIKIILDVETLVNQANKLGLPPPTSDSHTINGKPGPLLPCSSKHTFSMEVEAGKTYLLRIINAALNDELFFATAGHNMTVVEIDAVYTKPFTTRVILIAPGQTTNVLIKADQPQSRYFMAARPFMDAPVPVDNKTVTAILHYKGIPNTVLPSKLPAPNNTNVALRYNNRLRSLNTPQSPAKVPLKVDHHLFYTVWVRTHVQVVKMAHYFHIKGVFKTDFPDRPPVPFNYTGVPLTVNLGTSLGTRLIDPPERNTVGVPTGGWTAIRFRADNPGVWFMHCHLELHTMWGLKMAFVVENGMSPEESIIPPPKDLPLC
ncbi:hypothetical protein GOBAR_AA06693 [Gossypium barbadense]|uniref:laccase n=1 Tax=Gossypium barbadense TaxID=3634 RepID=A0A2P5YEB6_GOSBA|nr:hypothetical protein GOBAR_AA06693 [Gossypium barbadense]